MDSYEESSFVPPRGVREAAKRGLEWNKQGHGGSGLTAGAVSRARSLAKGEKQTLAQLKRMRSFFARHEVNKSSKSWREGTPSKPSPSQVAWALWGGDAGMSWANRVVASEDKKRLAEAEIDLLFEKIGRLDMLLTEGAWTGSMGGNDPDFNKLRGGLKRFWIEKAATSAHPFSYCVRHLRKHVANPERLCAWLVDQSKGTTKWRKGSKITEANAEEWEPTIEEMRAALMAFTEAAEELGLISEGGEASGEAASPDAADEGGSSSDGQPDSGASESEGSEAGEQSPEADGEPAAEGAGE